MIFSAPLPFIIEFINQLDEGLHEYDPRYNLSKAQRWWLSFCLMGILISNSICWTKFEQTSMGKYKAAALSWMFTKTKLVWPLLMQVSITLIFKRYGITEGVLVGDDSNRKRAKITKRIFGAHKIYDTKTGGYFNGQNVVLLFLVTDKVSLPVGFRFYQPDPAIAEWKKNELKLKKQGVEKSERPAKPEPNPKFPTKDQLLLALLREFKFYHPNFKVKSVLGDALYGSRNFMRKASEIFNNVQTISQLAKDQKVKFCNNEMAVSQYFAKFPGVATTLKIRNSETMQVLLGSARLYVVAHRQKRFVVALKYQGEKEYRYLVATDMSWRAMDIAAAYTLRWLVEVFFEDWKLNEGWGKFAPQYDEEGSGRGLILSLLLDYSLILHPQQQARIENNLPACTVGSLQQTARMDALIDVIRGTLNAEDPHKRLDKVVEAMKTLLPLRDSKKHMSGKEKCELGPTPSLKRKAAVCST